MIDVEHPAHEKTLRADPAKIGGALKVLIEPGSVVELRALGVPSGRYANTISGYFDNLDAMALEAARLSDVGAVGVYFTLNPLKPSLLARSANRARIAGRDVPSAGDHDVTGRRWLLIDSDPNRPSGISASDEEKAAAFQRTRQVSTALRDAGWPHPIAADSGNGFHLLYRIDLPAEDGGLIQKVLEALAFRYGDDVVKIDTAVHNPARIDKLYGTFARKGDSTDDRPHRLSRITQVPASLEVVTEEKLRAVAAWRPPPDPKPNGGHSSRDFDLEQWIASHGIEVRGPYSWQGGRKWILPRCPWNQSHDNSASYRAACEWSDCGRLPP